MTMCKKKLLKMRGGPFKIQCCYIYVKSFCSNSQKIYNSEVILA